MGIQSWVKQSPVLSELKEEREQEKNGIDGFK